MSGGMPPKSLINISMNETNFVNDTTMNEINQISGENDIEFSEFDA